MFKRLILEDSSVYYVVTAFITAATVFCTISWRALRMPPSQVDQFARLPLNDDSSLETRER
jgi:hypothetical protein